jgi:hypothetical protein
VSFYRFISLVITGFIDDFFLYCKILMLCCHYTEKERDTRLVDDAGELNFSIRRLLSMKLMSKKVIDSMNGHPSKEPDKINLQAQIKHT